MSDARRCEYYLCRGRDGIISYLPSRRILHKCTAINSDGTCCTARFWLKQLVLAKYKELTPDESIPSCICDIPGTWYGGTPLKRLWPSHPKPDSGHLIDGNDRLPRVGVDNGGSKPSSAHLLPFPRHCTPILDYTLFGTPDLRQTHHPHSVHP